MPETRGSAFELADERERVRLLDVLGELLRDVAAAQLLASAQTRRS